jgi:hypothetical protein
VDLTVLAMQAQRDQMLVAQRRTRLSDETKAGLPGVRQARKQIADIGALEAELGFTEHVAVEEHVDFGNGQRADCPAFDDDCAPCR